MLMKTEVFAQGQDPPTANENANQDTIDLYNWILDLKNKSENKVISGQHVRYNPNQPFAYEEQMTKLYSGTGGVRRMSMTGCDRDGPGGIDT